MPDSQQVVLFNPETMFVPTAGYSQVAEVNKLGQLFRDRHFSWGSWP